MNENEAKHPGPWDLVGIIMGIMVIVMLIALVVAVSLRPPWPSKTSKVTLTSSPTHTPTPMLPTDTPTQALPTDTSTIPAPPADTPTLKPPTPTPTATPNPNKPDAIVKAEALNLRSGPGVVYDILGSLKRGDCLEVIGRNLAGDWLKVICPSGQKGWTACSLLQVNVNIMADVPVVQASPMPTPMDTSTPIATPKPTLLPPPILTEPENGATFIGGPIILKWKWDYRPRAPNEIFSLRVRREGETEPCHHYPPRDTEYWGDLFSYCSAGKHYWSVTLVRELCQGCPEEKRWQNLSEPSEERWIYYVPGDEPWTWPEPPEPPGPQPQPGPPPKP